MSRPLNLRLTEAAEADFAEIWATLATEASQQVAARFVVAITATLESVRHFPVSGPTREQLSPGLRVIFHSPYAVYYRALPDAVVIIRVIHGARDITALAKRGGLA